MAHFNLSRLNCQIPWAPLTLLWNTKSDGDVPAQTEAICWAPYTTHTHTHTAPPSKNKGHPRAMGSAHQFLRVRVRDCPESSVLGRESCAAALDPGRHFRAFRLPEVQNRGHAHVHWPGHPKHPELKPNQLVGGVPGTHNPTAWMVPSKSDTSL